MAYVVYCHTNRNTGKRYVGYTRMTMMQRWNVHLKHVDKGSNLLFHNSIRKHGVDAWDHDVICDNVEKLDYTKLLERHFIEMLGTFENGYNMTTGGDGCPNHTPWNKGLKGIQKAPTTAFKKGMKPWNIGKQLSLDHVAKLTAFMRKRGNSHYTEEVRQKQIAAQNKPVRQMTLSGEIITEYASMTEASKITGICHISCVCRGVRKAAGGFMWSFVI